MYELKDILAIIIIIFQLIILIIIPLIIIILFSVIGVNMVLSLVLMLVYRTLMKIKSISKYEVIGKIAANTMIIVKILYVWRLYELLFLTITSFVFKKKRINHFFEYSNNGKIHQSLNLKSYKFLKSIEIAYSKNGIRSICSEMINNNLITFIKENPNMKIEVNTNNDIVRLITNRVPGIRFIPQGVPKINYQISERLSLIPYNKFIKILCNKKDRKNLFNYITKKVIVNKYTIEIVNN